MQNQIFGRRATNLLFITDKIYDAKVFDLPFDHNKMADLICTNRELLSPLFTDFEHKKTIDIREKRITIITQPLCSENT